MGSRVLALLAVLAATTTSFAPAAQGWNYGTATFYGGRDGSGTMGGACGYGNLYQAGYGTNTAALSSVLFNDGAACGQCYLVMCDGNASPSCRPGAAVTVTATNFCPPNWAQPSNSGGWCNPPRPHFDMAQPAWERIGVYGAGIIPVRYQQVTCWRQGGMRITIGGSSFFQLVQFSNVAGSGSIRSVSVKGAKTGWVALNRNWGANWQCNSALFGQALSFSVTSTGGQTIYMTDVVPAWWQVGMVFTTNYNFYY
ncbi:Expansin-A25 [Zea mays]|uniref:Expansin n=1 Tax=Zea mays TaxID=4577 RepID=A0A3L6DGY1_MAIZE|nr:Expansin-A25 [Zea mays]